MSRKKQETKVLCPGCGTEFAIADKEFAATGTVIGKNSDLGTVYPVVAGHNSPAGLPKGARERIEALRGAGVDVSCRIIFTLKLLMLPDYGERRNLY